MLKSSSVHLNLGQVHLGQDKGRPLCRKGGAKLRFLNEGGKLPPTAPPKSAAGYGLSMIFQNRRFERSLFTLHDPAPLNFPTKTYKHTFDGFNDHIKIPQ